MFFAVLQILGGYTTDKGVRRIAVSQQRADGQQNFGYGQCRWPVVLQDVQTDHTLTVDVTVVYPRPERNLSTSKHLTFYPDCYEKTKKNFNFLNSKHSYKILFNLYRENSFCV